MKKIFVMVVAIIMVCCAGALAEDVGIEALGGVELLPGEEVNCDIDGDGVSELVKFFVEENNEEYTETACLDIYYGDTFQTGWRELLYSAKVYLCDVDADGAMEIFVTGDVMSCDYQTYCMHYYSGELAYVMFPDIGRGDTYEGMFNYGYGYIEHIGEGTLTLVGSQDVLGTYFGARTFGLYGEEFLLVDEGLWRFEHDFEDAGTWEYGSLKPLVDIPAYFFEEEGEVEGWILAGERFLVTASDRDYIVYFRTEDGRAGYFFIEPSPEGYGSTIFGYPEYEVFEYLPYAD